MRRLLKSDVLNNFIKNLLLSAIIFDPFADVAVADLPSRRALRSASTSRLVQPLAYRSTVVGRTFPVAGPQVWNGPMLEVVHRNRPHTFEGSSAHSVLPGNRQLVKLNSSDLLSGALVDLAVFLLRPLYKFLIDRLIDW